MDFWRSLSGMVRVEITSADPGWILERINNSGIQLQDIEQTGELSIQASVLRQDYRKMHALLEKQHTVHKVISRYGLFWLMKAFAGRPILCAGLVTVLFLGILLPGRIFFVNVEGNLYLPDRLILEQAEGCGIGFGASRKAVRSEKVKNALLSAIPELQWVGVNTSGCVATVCVREKERAELSEPATGAVSSIVADRDGIIVSSTVYAGTAQCSVGQAVKEGQVLVSGYTDCGLLIQATSAEAEIVASTYRALQAVAPAEALARGTNTRTETKYSLLLGKKLINFYKDSGISDTTCVKMYTEDYWTLPGGFALPIALVTEQWTYYDVSRCVAEEAAVSQWLSEAMRVYLLKQMRAGQILTEQTRIQPADGVYCFSGQYACLEMIGRIKYEENLHRYGEDD